jgi:uncharacterized protein (UPF0264 family)
LTQLLVSVRDRFEAAIALEGGADLIDVKEPLAGSLGAARIDRVREVIDHVGGRLPTSAALGELVDCQPENLLTLPKSLSYVKLGLAGCAKLSDWPQRWSAAARAISSPTRLVAVVYADRAADAPCPDEIIRHAVTLNCGALLVDTFDKGRGNLFHHWTIEQVERFVRQARRLGVMSVLAGSLSREAIAKLLPLQPDYVAVRGAVCRGSRTTIVDRDLVANLADLVRSGTSPLLDAVAATPHADSDLVP